MGQRSLKVIEIGPTRKLGCGVLFAFCSNLVSMAVSVAVCEFKEWCDLENRVRVRSRSLEMAPFDRSHTSPYSPSIVTMAISCIVCEIQRLIVENRKMFLPHLYSSPPQGVTPSKFREDFDADKTRMIGLGYRTVNVKPFSSDTGTSRTDRRTDRQTDRQNPISISRAIKTTLGLGLYVAYTIQLHHYHHLHYVQQKNTRMK